MTLPPLSLRARITALTAATAVLATVAVGYTVAAADGDGRSPESVAAPGLTLDEAPGLYHAARNGDVRSAPYSSSGTGGAADDARSRNTGLSCDRFYASGRSAVCIASHPGISQKTKVSVLDRKLNTRKTVVVGGIPNRARVSPSGRMLAWTLFVSGDSYASSSFSTRTGILDTRTGYLVKNVETLQLYLEGRRYHAPDVNYWGVTFADDNRFYATVATKGKTYLVEGDIRTWKARTLRRNAECPSLSPDGTRIAFKKRVREGAQNPWRLHVLDVKTMRETPVTETRSVDDQAAWLDDSTLAYALPGRAKGTSDIWTVPVGTSAAEPRLLLRDASSPSMVAASS
ncbi:TolB family protein [Streptomyces sp. rh34]|uniref:TolB family protein n=1 Tax=Streptomyces sp. rh34 TaxID=2034272 RepID=UPI000BEF9D57|nr:PD40 domain-containing protein [Streptomyces sp. rh34]